MNSNQTYIAFNATCVFAAYFMMGLSIWLAPVDLSTKGYWAMAVLLLTGSLVNLVKYRMDARIEEETVAKIEKAKNEKLLADYVQNDQSAPI
ncbi:MAG: YiaA/YiaB family inner membrane protein [Pseudomonadota bacterium]